MKPIQLKIIVFFCLFLQNFKIQKPSNKKIRTMNEAEFGLVHIPSPYTSI